MKERGNNTWITGNSALPFLNHQIISHTTWNLPFNKWSHFWLFITKNSRGLCLLVLGFFSFPLISVFVLLGKIIWHFFSKAEYETIWQISLGRSQNLHYMKKTEKRQKVELLSEGKENTGANYSAVSYIMCHFVTEK